MLSCVSTPRLLPAASTCSSQWRSTPTNVASGMFEPGVDSQAASSFALSEDLVSAPSCKGIF